jgi:F-type H+-transporting ATPase subunit epsilon
MANTFRLSIFTPDTAVFSGEAVSLIVPAEGGYLGVLAHHASLIAALVSGVLTVKDAFGSSKVFQSSGTGFLEVSHNQATVLLDKVVMLSSA